MPNLSWTNIARASALLIALGLILLWTWSGQQFLAHNVNNDADSSYFAYGGWLIQQGGKLYVDFWDQKPPLIFYQNAGLIALFGLNFKAWAWVHGIAFLLALLIGARQVARTVGTPWALAWAVAVAYGFNLNNYLDFGNRTEFGVAWFELLAMACVLRWIQHPRGTWMACAGSCAALASLYKPVGMASLLATMALGGLAILYIWKCTVSGNIKNINTKNNHRGLRGPQRISPCSSDESSVVVKIAEVMDEAKLFDAALLSDSDSLAATLKNIFWLCLGFAMTLSVVLMPLALQGSLLEVWRATITVPLSLTGGTGRGLVDAALDLPLRMGPLWGFLWPWILWPWAYIKADTKQKVTLLWLALWTLATLCGIILQRHGHPHYYHPAVVPLLTGSFFSAAILFNAWEKQKIVRWALVLLLSISGVIFARYFVVRQWQGVKNLPQVEASYEPYRQVGQWLAEELKKSENAESTFYYWSMGYSPYLAAQVRCPGKISPSILTLGDRGAEMVQEDLRQLQQRSNIVFLLENPSVFPTNIGQAETFPDGSLAQQVVQEYCQWRDQRYEPVEGDFGPFLVFRRRG